MFARTRREYDDAQKGGQDVSWPPYGFRGQVLQGFAFFADSKLQQLHQN